MIPPQICLKKVDTRRTDLAPKLTLGDVGQHRLAVWR